MTTGLEVFTHVPDTLSVVCSSSGVPRTKVGKEFGEIAFLKTIVPNLPSTTMLELQAIWFAGLRGPHAFVKGPTAVAHTISYSQVIMCYQNYVNRIIHLRAASRPWSACFELLALAAKLDSNVAVCSLWACQKTWIE